MDVTDGASIHAARISVAAMLADRQVIAERMALQEVIDARDRRRAQALERFFEIAQIFQFALHQRMPGFGDQIGDGAVGAAPGEPLALFVGSGFGRKGLSTLVDALALRDDVVVLFTVRADRLADAVLDRWRAVSSTR